MIDGSSVGLLRLLSTISILVSGTQSTAELVAKFASDVEIQCPPTSCKYRRSYGNSSQDRDRGIGNNGTFLMTNVTFQDSGTYECLDDSGNVTREIRLTVGDVPDIPSGTLSLRTEPFLKYMDCCWNVSRCTGIDTVYSLHYVKLLVMPMQWTYEIGGNACHNRINATECVPGDALPMQCCRIPIRDPENTPGDSEFISFKVTLVSANALGHRSWNDPTLRYSPNTYMIPPKPLNLRANLSSNGTVNIATFHWDRPNIIDMQLEYYVRYRKSNGAWIELEPMSTLTKTLYLDLSFGDLQVQVRAKPDDLKYGSYKGDWSKVASATLQSKDPTVPFNFYEVICDSTPASGNITITAKWISQYRKSNPNIRYEFSFDYENGTRLCEDKIVEPFRVSYSKTIPNVNHIDFNGRYCNALGCSPDTKVPIQSTLAPAYESVVTLKKIHDGLLASWQGSNTVSNTSRNCTVKLISLHRSNELIHTVMSKYENMSCENGRLNISAEVLQTCAEYLFTVSAIQAVHGVIYATTHSSEIVNIIENSALDSAPLRWNVTNVDHASFTVSWEHTGWDNNMDLQPRIVYRTTDNDADVYSNVLKPEDTSYTVTEHIIPNAQYRVGILNCCVDAAFSVSGKMMCLKAPTGDFDSITIPQESFDKTAFASVVAIGLAFVILTFLLVFKKRKRLKPLLLGATERRIPSPNIFIALDREAVFRPALEPQSAETESEYRRSYVDENTCVGAESFSEFQQPLMDDTDGDDILDYAVAIGEDSTNNNNDLDEDKDYDQDYPQIIPMKSVSPEDHTHTTLTPLQDTTNDDLDSLANETLTTSNCRQYLSEPDYACSYAIVPGYLSCTSPDEVAGIHSSVDTLTEYATFGI